MHNLRMNGKFIAIEGCDGSGLSTQTSIICGWLKEKGFDVLETKEPTDNFIGKTIRSILKKEIKTGQKTLQLLFCADRAHHLETEIIPALENGKIVVTDRYVMSTLAFGAMDVDVEWLKKLNDRFPKPDLTMIIDVPAEVSIERIKKSRPEIELFEEKEKLEKIRENYRKLSKESPNTIIVDGTESIGEVSEKIKAEVEKLV